MGWLIFFAILVLLACLPLGAGLRYDEQGFAAVLLLGHVRIRLYPVPQWLDRLLHRPKKEKPPKEPKNTAPPPSREAPAEPKKTGGDWKRFLPLVRTGLDFLGDLRRKLRVNNLTLHITLAGDDPADLAVSYGRAWAALGNLMPQLSRAFVIKKRDIQVACDFAQDKTRVVFAMDLTITLGRLLSLAVGYGIRIVKQFLNMKKNKAVDINE